MNDEHKRLKDIKPWRVWGPYLSARQWGTVREDYSKEGNAWDYFPFADAVSRAYRWGEDGIGGISDKDQIICFAPAFWNGKDEIIKERFFGLNNSEGNHGEDLKEYYYYLDNTPSHSYMKMLYKYPHNAFPYEKLINENRSRDTKKPEYELIDTGIFDQNRYFDIFIEYAKNTADDILIRITALNRGDENHKLAMIPQLWFRNTWSWNKKINKPQLRNSGKAIIIEHKRLENYSLYDAGDPELLFTENETNNDKLFMQNGSYTRDGINEYIVNKRSHSVNPEMTGTKAALIYEKIIAPGDKFVIRLRLSGKQNGDPFKEFENIFERRISEADEFYTSIQHDILNEDERNVQRQAFAGMLWNKQFYSYNTTQWLNGDEVQPPAERRRGRNAEWFHLNNSDIISMPDKWEYPWYATWDSAFHSIPLAIIDPEFAKEQLLLFTEERYMHPNGQLPAYEWNLSDVNPPVHAWASWRVYKIDEKQKGKGDLAFLERIFHKLLLNFTWWVNKKDVEGRNIFQGGFLGMDNVGIIDRSNSHERIDQADGTSWMAMYSLNLMRIALELAKSNPVYQDLAYKYFEHFLYIAGAMTNLGGEGIGLWDDEDQFYYDVLGSDNRKIKVRSMVGLVPLFAVEVLEPETFDQLPEFTERIMKFLDEKPELASLVSRWYEAGKGERHLLSLLRGSRMKKLLLRMLDENEFLSCSGVRSLSKVYGERPYVIHSNGELLHVQYSPAESDSRMFGGNSNWRGPVWFPMNFLIIESLQRFHHYYGDDFKIEYPVGSGVKITINDAAILLTKKLKDIFLRDEQGKRKVYGSKEKFQTDPHFRDYILFYEYFNGDTGEGLGASHQTGWTGLIAKLLQPRREDVNM